ncbi:MAG: undecaprenyl/decaprenyl-phosphate alpha-N-acetylglucosaminyl 1-phosphate transferase [Ferruginibacter sp.]|nr:undecaprenyl/decaprenyl-phosphate alpha-N-acetylglucosaminyl 1-phosphate transferase [Ferruginibacter sp.]
MDNIILSAALAFLITFFSIPVIIQIAKDKKLFDEPDERKVHKVVIPTLGGLGIFAGFIIGMLLGVPSNLAHEMQFFIAASIVIFFLGMKDDILILSASKKFMGQLLAAGILIKFGGVQISNMHGVLGIHELPNIASIVLSLLTIVVITNSFNLIDGIDGLAGSLGILTTTIFGVYFLYTDHLMYAVMAFSLAGALGSFLIYNFSPAKIFMGDTGSLLLGLINAILVIKFINIAGTPTSKIFFDSSPAIGFAILMVPLTDTLRVFSLRLLNRRSPFSPDRLHIHHFLLDLGWSHRKITLCCVSMNIIFIAAAYFMRSLGPTAVLLIMLGVAATLTYIVYHFRQKKTIQNAAPTSVHEKQVVQSKFFSLASDPIEAD